MKNLLLLSAFIIGLLMLGGSCQTATNENPGTTNTGDEVGTAIDFNKDTGGEPWVLDIEDATITNDNYRATNWTGKNLQLVFMSLKPGEIIDLEVHEGHDQFIRIENGKARVLMGKTKDDLNFIEEVSDDWAVLIPAGYWHSVENIGDTDLKLYTLYGPPEHQKGTTSKTYEEARESHDHEH